MASLVKRGSRSTPKWFVKWDVRTVDGKTKQKWKLLPGIVTAPDAHGELARVERALSKDEDPFPTPDRADVGRGAVPEVDRHG